jgi:hypothetical protein
MGQMEILTKAESLSLEVGKMLSSLIASLEAKS